MSVLVLSVIVIWLMSQPGRSVPALATVGASRHGAASGGGFSFIRPMAATATGPDGPPRTTRSARARGYRDPLARHRAVVGPDVRTSILIRIRALILLALIVAAIGAAIAGATLLLIASGRFLLELLAG